MLNTKRALELLDGLRKDSEFLESKLSRTLSYDTEKWRNLPEALRAYANKCWERGGNGLSMHDYSDPNLGQELFTVCLLMAENGY